MSIYISPNRVNDHWFMWRYHRSVNRLFGSVIGILIMMYIYIVVDLPLPNFLLGAAAVIIISAGGALIALVAFEILKGWFKWIFYP